jgi:hypothetical protein
MRSSQLAVVRLPRFARNDMISVYRRSSAVERRLIARGEMYKTNPNFATADWGLRIERGRLRAGAGGKMRKTNPIWPGRRVNVRNEPNFAPPQEEKEETAQNEAKLGWTGVYG